MAFLCIVINDSFNSIPQLNAKSVANAVDAGNGEICMQLLTNYLDGLKAGTNAAATVQVTTRDTDPSIATSGTSSTQVSYTNFA